MKIILIGASGSIGKGILHKKAVIACKECVEGKRNGEVLNVVDFA